MARAVLNPRRYWRTPSGVLVVEFIAERQALVNRKGVLTTKCRCFRAATGGFHGWLWHENLIPAKRGSK